MKRDRVYLSKPDRLPFAPDQASALTRLMAVLESSFDGIFITDGQATPLWCNHSYEIISGLTAADVLGIPMAQLVATGVISHSSTLKALNQGQAVTLEQTFTTGKQAVVTSTPIYDQDDKVCLVVTNVRDISELTALQETLDQQRRLSAKYRQEMSVIRAQLMTTPQLVAEDPATLNLLRIVSRAAQLDTVVLIQGETGTGKEVVARALHRRSGRTGEFVAINCGALPRDLLATELFGYEGGAFTGARETGAVGKFEFADGGTLFLDEIGEMPVDMQVSLLRVLQEQSVTKLGSNTAKTLDVRVIAATNQNIERLISEKKFRSDLYYRLSLVEIRLPQLRRRSADIPPLVDYFNGQLSSVLEVPCTPFPAETIEALQAYSWPGNVRELRNIVERCLIMQGQGANVTVDSLPPHIANAANAMPDGPVAHAAVAVQQDAGAMREGVEDDAVSEERHLVQALLAQHEGDLAAVGRQLGLTHEELSELLNRLHLRVRVVLESMDDAF